jgi:crotonobetainyl-CoA:carnitine CoA-transferase CaiB-like acyl-CoA transferase
MSEMLLDDIRVIDLTAWWAGPMMTGLLATMGAEVIKIESTQRMDGWRQMNPLPGDRPWERCAVYAGANHSKRSFTLDLTRPRGVDVFKNLVKKGDIVAENFTPRVMKNFGLDYSVLNEINPRIVMISMPAFGMTGPWRDYGGFAANLEQMSGFNQLTGYPGEGPLDTNMMLSDPIAGVYGLNAVLTALRYQRQTGHGQYIDLSQLEADTATIGEFIIDYTVNHRVPRRVGNSHRSMAPHGCYRCKGEDKWVTILVATEDEWSRFCQAIGSPVWTQNEKFSNVSARWNNQEELNNLIETWTRNYTHYEVMFILQAAGVAATPVLGLADIPEDPHVRAGNYYQEVNHAVLGRFPVSGIPMEFSETPWQIKSAPPLLGQDNDYVLGDLLGMTREEIAALAAEGIIGTEPSAAKK